MEPLLLAARRDPFAPYFEDLDENGRQFGLWFRTRKFKVRRTMDERLRTGEINAVRPRGGPYAFSEVIHEHRFFVCHLPLPVSQNASPCWKQEEIVSVVACILEGK